ncbi:MAG: YbaB/EbfC family nucleoid-associated protein [Elusimicrobiota bacterium]
MGMMDFMKQAGKLKKIQRDINKTKIDVDTEGLSITVTGAGKVKRVSMSEELYKSGRRDVEKEIKQAVTECFSKQQEVQKTKAQEAMSGMDLPGM